MYTVRRALPHDVDRIVSLVKGYWSFERIDGFDHTRIKDLLTGLLAQPGQGSCWVAEVDGALCGYLLLVYVFSLEHGGSMAEIDEFFVRPENRSAGVGVALLDEAEAALRNEGFVRLQLQLGSDNNRARSFYERQGYGRRSGYDLWDKAL